MITVHNLDNSRSVRIIWLLEELGIEFEIKQYTRRKDNNLAPDEYLKLHPMGKSPVITDGDLVLVESGAIMDYILQRYGKGKLEPATDSEEWLRYRYWYHAAEGSLMPLLVLKLILGRMESKVPFFLKPPIMLVTHKVKAAYVDPSLKRFFTYMNDELANATWLSGETFTAADIMMGFPLEAAVARGGILDNYPNIGAYVGRIKERQAHMTAMEKNGPMNPF